MNPLGVSCRDIDIIVPLLKWFKTSSHIITLQWIMKDLLRNAIKIENRMCLTVLSFANIFRNACIPSLDPGMVFHMPFVATYRNEDF